MDANVARLGATPILYSVSAASQTLRRPQCGRDIDLTVIFKSGRILSSSFRCAILYLSIPIPFIMPNRLISAPYLALLSNYAIYAYLIYITHVPYIMMAVHQTPLSCFVTPIWTMSGLSDFSTIIFTFSIIPYLILFVKHYFRNQHSDCNTIFTKIHIIISLKKL